MSAPALFERDDWAIRVVHDDHAPWFVAADIARALGYRDAHNLTRRLDPDDRGTRSVSTPSGDQEMTVISEPGLYTAVIGSQVESAVTFKRWITHDVLPAIRQTGGYQVAQLDRRALALMVIEEADRADVAERRALEAEDVARELHPAAAAWDHLACAYGDYDVSEAAKILSRDPGIKIGRNRLFDQLAEWGWTYRSGYPARPEPYQAQVDLGRLVLHTYDHAGAVRSQVRVTPKGLAEIHKRLGGKARLALPEAEPTQLALVPGGAA